MARLEIVAKAQPYLILPVLLTVFYLERSAAIPPVTKAFNNDSALDGGVSVRLSLNHGKQVSDGDILPYLGDLAILKSEGHRAQVS